MAKGARLHPEPPKDRKCVAEECEERIKLTFIFCTKHWNMIPETMQIEVYDLYKPGQFGELVGVQIRPSDEWLQMVRKAIRSIEVQEKRQKLRDEQRGA